MPDKKPTDVTDNNVGKITDSEIIKAFEWLKTKTKEHCKQCHYKNSEVCDICVPGKLKLVFDYYDHLQAENERLKKTLKVQGERLAEERGQKYEQIMIISKLKEQLETAKAEAVTEFAERLKEKGRNSLGNQFVIGWIDNLLKELVGDDNA